MKKESKSETSLVNGGRERIWWDPLTY